MPKNVTARNTTPVNANDHRTCIRSCGRCHEFCCNTAFTCSRRMSFYLRTSLRPFSSQLPFYQLPSLPLSPVTFLRQPPMTLFQRPDPSSSRIPGLSLSGRLVRSLSFASPSCSHHGSTTLSTGHRVASDRDSLLPDFDGQARNRQGVSWIWPFMTLPTATSSCLRQSHTGRRTYAVRTVRCCFSCPAQPVPNPRSNASCSRA